MANDNLTKGEPPFIFVIDISVNPEAAAAIGEYMAGRGKMNIYRVKGDVGPVELDEGDMRRRDHYLQEGLLRATHVLGLIAPEAPNPWWINRIVELGSVSGVELALLTLKGMTDDRALNSAFEVLRGIKSLNEYLFRFSSQVDRIIFNNPEYGGLMAHTAPNHPLDTFLDWEC